MFHKFVKKSQQTKNVEKKLRILLPPKLYPDFSSQFEIFIGYIATVWRIRC